MILTLQDVRPEVNLGHGYPSPMRGTFALQSHPWER